MATGDSLTAGRITTASSTTDLVATFKFENFHPHEFTGPVIFRVGPSNISGPNAVLDEAGWNPGAWALWRDRCIGSWAANSMNPEAAGVGVSGDWRSAV